MELEMLVMVIIFDCKISSRTFESTDDKAIA